MKVKRNGQFNVATVLICAVILIIVTAWVTAFVVNSYVSTSFVKGPFYRTTKQLSHDGIELIDMGNKQERLLREMIWDFYQTEYPKMVKEVFEDRMADTSSSIKRQEEYAYRLEILEEAHLAPPIFSAPRKHKELDGVVGIMASAYMYTSKDGLFHRGEYMFFFRKQEKGYSLEKTYLLGEDPRIFETSPWNSLMREIDY